MKYQLFILSLSVILCCGCTSGDDEASPSTEPFKELDIVTGMYLTDANGAAIGTWRQANDKPGTSSIYPNPALDQIFVTHPQAFKRILVIPASCFHDSMTVDIPNLAQSLDFTLPQILTKDVIDLPLSNTTTLATVDLASLPAGFYKVFIQLDNDQIFWHNLYADPAGSGIVDFSMLDATCL